jgi:hypothetical protein
MKRSIALMTGAAVIAGALSGPALSQGTPQTAAIMKVDPASLATGHPRWWAAPSSMKQTKPWAQSTI